MEPLLLSLGNPEVMKLWTVIKVRILAGQACRSEDSRSLHVAVSGLAELPVGFDRQAVVVLIERLEAFCQIIMVVDAPYPSGVWTPGIPRGEVSLIRCPCLPQGQHYWLPSGDLAYGVGGQTTGGTSGAASQLSVEKGDAAKLLNLPLGVGAPLPESSADISKRVTGGVLLMNPIETGATIQYAISNQTFSMTPNFRQALPDSRAWDVRFERGQSFGSAHYTLSKGTYVFGSAGRGWDLYSQKFEVTIDNSANQEAFYYAIDNTEAEVPAGGRVTHKGDYPLLVRFDRGDGMQASQKAIEKASVSLVVALNRADGLWDLYPAGNFPGQKLAAAPQDASALERGCCE
jgi:hypothetical protein